MKLQILMSDKSIKHWKDNSSEDFKQNPTGLRNGMSSSKSVLGVLGLRDS
jgi:hypothetical protein